MAVGMLGGMYSAGKGVTPSFRRSREYIERAIELGDSLAVEGMQDLSEFIQALACAQQRFLRF
jgi:TPR repeat protein